MKATTGILIFLLAFSQACTNASKTDTPSGEKQEPITIDLQPFNAIANEQVSFVYQELKKIYPKVRLNKPIALPAAAFYKPRNRYRADSLISFLRRSTPEGHVTIGLTNKDISSTKGKTKDYGVMGLGYRPGPSCVVSTFRLSKNNLLEQYFKLSVHELGHTQGLPHCAVKTCFMRDAEGKNHTDEETGFCTKCLSHLISRGWTFRE